MKLAKIGLVVAAVVLGLLVALPRLTSLPGFAASSNSLFAFLPGTGTGLRPEQTPLPGIQADGAPASPGRASALNLAINSPEDPLGPGSKAAAFKENASDFIPNGTSKVCNNMWGAPGTEKLLSGVYLNRDKAFGWYWDRPDPAPRPGNDFVQPIYPSLRVGGSPWEASRSAAFPVRVRDIDTLALDVSYNYPAVPTGTYDLAYDLFFTDTDEPSATPKPNAEVMIWIHGSLGQPAEAFRGEVSDGENAYDLYSFVMGNGRQYFAFILKAQPQFQMDLRVDAWKLIEGLDLDPAWYLHGVDFGNEVVSGSGKIQIDRLEVTLNGEPV